MPETKLIDGQNRVVGLGPFQGLEYARLTMIQWAISKNFARYTIHDRVIYDYSLNGAMNELYQKMFRYVLERFLSIQGKEHGKFVEFIANNQDLQFLMKYAHFRFDDFYKKANYQDVIMCMLFEIRGQMADFDHLIKSRMEQDDLNIFQLEKKCSEENFKLFKALESFTP